MFFGKESDFSEESLMLTDQSELKDWARKLIKELNLMKRDALEAELYDTAAWRFMIKPDALLKMHEEYARIEAEIYVAAEKILIGDGALLASAKAALVKAITNLKTTFYSQNAQLIRDLGMDISRLPDE
jgi:hypothetical protein